MNGNIILLTCVFILQRLCVNSELIEPEIEEYDGDLEDVSSFNNERREGKVNSTVFKTVNKYNCSLDSEIEGSHLIVYGTNGWTFPVQDVNLTLRYPMADKVHDTFGFNAQNKTKSEVDEEEYLITGFTVILYIDGLGSQGYIVDGGVLQDTIILSFVSSQITMLKYQFWLYGVSKDTAGTVELKAYYHFC